MATANHVLISVIVPLYNEAIGLGTFNDQLTQALSHVTDYDFEILYCDDGSTDSTLEVLHKIAADDKRIKIVKLTRNFGKEAAMTAGITAAHGSAIITIDGDGQHPINKLPDFLAAWRNGSRVVIGRYKVGLHDSYVKKIGSRWYYRIVNKLGGPKVEPRNTDYRLLDKSVRDQFVTFTEHNRLTRGLIDWLGYNPHYVDLELNSRQGGIPAYSVSKLIKLATDSIVATSLRPLYFAAVVGVIILPSSILLGVIMVSNALLGDPIGWHATGSAYISVILLFLVGLLMISQGITGLYLAHIYSETQARPLYIIDPMASKNLVDETQ